MDQSSTSFLTVVRTDRPMQTLHSFVQHQRYADYAENQSKITSTIFHRTAVAKLEISGLVHKNPVVIFGSDYARESRFELIDSFLRFKAPCMTQGLPFIVDVQS